ncbi:MAG: hypothetical protein HKUEN01_19160 [Candidatus Kuenenia stuttgartiensis]|nr:MAG: hypothetical protein HKUEN01_19160 [Candidatus Kuenenia stuttgartiensis]
MQNLFKFTVYIVFLLYLAGMVSFLSAAHADNFEMIRVTEHENQAKATEITGTIHSVEGEGAWTGIDVSIVGKYASQYGRPPRDPYINTDQGDLLLFVFTIAGVIGGFVIGFNARKIFYEK